MTTGRQDAGKRKKGRVMSRMVRAVLRRNHVQAAALGGTYLLTFALLVMLVFFYPSIEKTFDSYLAEYHLPEATILTVMLREEAAGEALDEAGIRSFVTRTVVEAPVRFENGKTVSCRFVGVSGSEKMRFHDVIREEDVEPDEGSVMISSYFAFHNDVAPGDSLTVTTAAGAKELTVTQVVSSPETISTNRDAFSWYDSNDFAYLFVGTAGMDRLFGGGGYCNRIDLYFEEGADGQEVLAAVEENLGSAVVHAGTFEGSQTQKQLEAALEGTKAVVTYMPILLIGMGILFSTLFFIQIVNRSEKQNGLLMALGYDLRRISLIYVRCALRLTLLAAVFGFALGAVLLRTMLEIYVSTYDLPFVRYGGSLFSLPVLLLLILLVGALSSLLSCLRLRSLDPARVFSSVDTGNKTDLPAWIGRLRAGAFVKLSICGIYRNGRRFFLSVLCGVACLILTFMAVSMITSKNESIRYLFRERFRYDLGVRCAGSKAAQAVAALPGVERAELVLEMDLPYEDETVIVAAMPAKQEMIGIMSAAGEELRVPEEGILLEEGFARRHQLEVGDEMVLGGASLTVEGITREYYNSIQYVSFAAAGALGETEVNTVLLTLSDGQDRDAFVAALGKTDGFQYYFDRESREACVRSILSTLDLPCYVFALFSAVIGAVIVSTMNLVTIARRRRKYAVLCVLGTRNGEFLGMELPEVFLQFVLTIVLGAVPAGLCTGYIFRQMSVPSQEFVVVNPLLTVLVSAAVVALYLLFGVLVTLRAIRRMKYLEILGEK